MLSHNDVHYIVGLLWRYSSYGSPEVVLGDRVYDEAAQKKRDVDVTVLYKNGQNTCALAGIEVKDEKEPLDVITVEGLCLKLADMPSISQKGIVSASGYTDGAIKKAKRHGVDLYELEEWDVTKEEPDFLFKFNPEFFYKISEYLWSDMFIVLNPNEKIDESIKEVLNNPNTPILEGDGTLSSYLNIQGLIMSLSNVIMDDAFYDYVDSLNLKDDERRDITSPVRTRIQPLYIRAGNELYPIKNFRARLRVGKKTQKYESVFKKLVCLNNPQFKLGCVVTKPSKSHLTVSFMEPGSNHLKTSGIFYDERQGKRIYKVAMS